MIFLLKVLLLICFVKFHLINAQNEHTNNVYFLEQGTRVHHGHADRNHFKIYCYVGKPKHIIHLWQSVSIELDMQSNSFIYYEGPSPDIVHKEYVEHHSGWAINLFSWKQKYFRLDPFNQSCIGIDSNEDYNIVLHVIRVDYWKIICFVIGLILFFSADRLSKNVLFYYLCGISLGVFASFLILIYFLSKAFPKRPMMYGFAICGWTIGVYILQMLWENIRTILMNYQRYVMWYAVITGIISFVVCYWRGPVTNERTRNLIRWSLQGSGLIGVFYNSQYHEAAMGQIVIVLLVYNFPERLLSKSKTYWRKRFPPKVKLLSNAEYYQQGVKETANALKGLKRYCSSPECNQWKTVLKLKDVKRFASFMDGNSHLSDNEILEYETSIHTTDLTDDEDLLTDEDT